MGKQRRPVVMPGFKEHTGPRILSLLENFLRFWHYVGVVPFKISSFPTDGVRLSYPVYKGFFVCLSITSYAVLLIYFLQPWVEALHAANVELPALIRGLVFGLLVMIVTLTRFALYKNASGFENIMRCMKTVDERLDTRTMTAAPFICTVLVVFSVLSILADAVIVMKLDSHSFYEAIYEHAERFRLMHETTFGCGDLEPLNRTANSSFKATHIGTNVSKPSVGYCVFAGAALIVITYENLMVHFAQYLCPAIAFVFWVLVRRSVEGMKGQDSLQEKLIVWQDFRELSVAIKDTIGGIIMFMCFEALPFYCIKLQDALYGDWVVRVQAILNVAPLLVFIALSADAHAQIQLGLLAAKRKQPSFGILKGLGIKRLRQGNIALYELTNDSIGIRGKYFTITYSLLGTIYASIIAYTVVAVQYSKDDPIYRSI